MKLNNETKIGIMVVACLAALAGLTVKVGDFGQFKKGYTVQVQFKNIDGVELNAPVRLNGLEVGKVQAIAVTYDSGTFMNLALLIDGSVRISEGAKAYVKTMGLMGEKYIALSSAGDEKRFLQPGALIIGQEPVDFEALMAQGEIIAANLADITTDLNDTLAKDLNASMANITEITSNLNDTIKKNRADIDEIVKNLNYISKNFGELSDDLKQHPWKLLFRTKEK